MDIKKVMGMKNLAELFGDEDLQKTYVSMYMSSHGSSKEDATKHFERETGFLKSFMADNPKLAKCTPFSVYTALLDIAYHNLSIEPVSKAQAYVLPRGYNKGNRSNPKWETRMYLMISSYGELYLRIKNGIIKYVDNVVLVHEGDDFKIVNGKVEHTGYMKSDKITHAYIRIVRPDGTDDYKAYSMSEILKYRSMSESPKSKHWTGGIDGQPTRGMIEAKVIKHAFNAYPRVNLGSSVITEDQIEASLEKDLSELASDAYIEEGFNEDDFDKDTGEEILAPSFEAENEKETSKEERKIEDTEKSKVNKEEISEENVQEDTDKEKQEVAGADPDPTDEIPDFEDEELKDLFDGLLDA